MEAEFLVAVVVSVFAIVDPIGTLPFFAALTDGFTEEDRRLVLRRSVAVLAAVLTLFAVAGRFLFAAFGFTLAAFEIAGGILLFFVAFDMLNGEIGKTRLGAEDRADALARRDEISVVPIGIPLLAGPGAISTVMIYIGSAGSNPLDIASTFIAIGVASAATYIVFRFGQG
ncbi:MAG TPA: MarC family protein, partial [Thermoplasmata archaeon]|nr:MarC family protein [Thermoplasmata archaeon]